jgi:hypothetical protein
VASHRAERRPQFAVFGGPVQPLGVAAVGGPSIGAAIGPAAVGEPAVVLAPVGDAEVVPEPDTDQLAVVDADPTHEFAAHEFAALDVTFTQGQLADAQFDDPIDPGPVEQFAVGPEQPIEPVDHASGPAGHDTRRRAPADDPVPDQHPHVEFATPGRRHDQPKHVEPDPQPDDLPQPVEHEHPDR